MQTGTVSRLRFFGRSRGLKIYFGRNIMCFWPSYIFFFHRHGFQVKSDQHQNRARCTKPLTQASMPEVTFHLMRGWTSTICLLRQATPATTSPPPVQRCKRRGSPIANAKLAQRASATTAFQNVLWRVPELKKD